MDCEQATIARDGEVTSTRTRPRTSRVEVITGVERRRRWSIDEKREIVAESLTPHIGAKGVIRKYGISSGQLYTWRRQLAQRLETEPTGLATKFARVNVVLAERPGEIGQQTETRVPMAGRQVGAPVIAPARAEGLIEILLPGGASVRVDAQVDVRALRRVLDALHGR
jgi:transposase